MNKTVGLILLTIGIGLTAGFGAVLSPDFRQTTIKDAEASFADAEVQKMHEEYCALRQNFKLPPAEGCSGSIALVDGAEELPTIARRVAELDALKQSKEVLILPVSQARTQYRLAIRKSLKRWRERERMGIQGPSQRLQGWLGQAGLGFGLGLVFVVVGAWICRKTQAVQASSPAEDKDGPLDFGALLGSVSASIDCLHGDMVAMEQPTVADLDGFKERLEDIQKEALARLCASGPRAQARYGLEGMAALFSPLSSAERKLNRAWATLVDRHWPEALVSVGLAAGDLKATQAALSDLT